MVPPSVLQRSFPVLLAALLGVQLGSCSDTPPPHPAAAGDVVLIVIDTCRRDALGCYGGPAGNTPFLDAFAQQNIRFERAIATSPWTLPSVTSMLTSRMPTVHGAYGLGSDLTRIRADIPTGPEELVRRGWGTAAVVNAPFLKPELGLARGFEVYDYVLRDSGRRARGRPVSTDSERRAGPSVDAALAYLNANRDRRDFLLLHVFDPHLPYDPPEEFAARARGDYEGDWEPPLRLLRKMRSKDWTPEPDEAAYLRRVYEAEVAYVDRELGRFFHELEASGLWKNATVVVTSDHGEELGDHGGWEHGHAMWDELVRVPLLMKLPARAPTQRNVVAAQVSLLDLMPTLFEIAQEPAPATFAGRSFLGMIVDEEEPVAREVVSERVHLGEEQFALRDAAHTWIWYDAESRGELYEWRRDPREMNEIADHDPGTASRLREKLLDRITAAEEEAQQLSPREEVGPSGELVEQLRALGYAGG